MWVLCVDFESYEFLSRNTSREVKLIYWRSVADDELQKQYQRYRNDIARFCWVSKTFFLKYLLLEQNVSKVVYVDADIICLSSPRKLFDVYLKKNAVCLTPHYFSGALRRKQQHAHSGVYNAGVIGVNGDAIPFLNWWQQKCYHRCGRFKDLTPEEGRVDDQGYLDSACTHFNNIKHIGREYNSGPWNTHGITQRNGTFLVGKRKIVFYHFHQLKVDDWHVRRTIIPNTYSISPVIGVYDRFEHELTTIGKRYVRADVRRLRAFLKQENLEDVLSGMWDIFQSNRNDIFRIEHLINVLYTIAAQYKRAHNFKKGEVYFNYITQTNTLISDHIRGGAFFHLGEILLKRGRYKQARQSFHDCLKRIPDHTQAQKYYAQLGTK